jgi:hypothetical protein
MFKTLTSFALLFWASACMASAEFKYSLEDYFDLHDRTHGDSAANPGNSVLRLEDFGATNDLRTEFKLTSDSLKAVFRPRWVFSSWQWTETNAYQQSAGHLDITDAFFDTRFSDKFHAALGLEVFQWGPAELTNISNPLFHLNTMSRSSFYKEKGQALIRLNYDVSDTWNNMLILNPVSNNEPLFMEGQEFQPSGFLKTEIKNQGGQTYLGGLAGSQPDGRKFFGEYFNSSFESGWSFYFDARHPLGERRFELQNKSGFKTETLVSNDSGLHALLLSGVRWEGRIDARMEYFYNSDGLNRNEFQDQLSALKAISPVTLLNFSRFLRPGLELYGQHYSYFSARIPDLGSKKDLQVALRSIVSLQDGSSISQLSVDKPLSDAFVGLLEAFTALGENDRELTLVDRTALIAGVKWSQ